MQRKYMSRVDRQVSLMMLFSIMLSVMAVYITCTYVSYMQTIQMMEDHVRAVHAHVEAAVPLDTTTIIQSKKEMDSVIYQDLRAKLQEVRAVGNLRYLYTATRTKDGQYIYSVDGLPLKVDGTPENPEDYRYPGDPIEPEILDQVAEAMSGNAVFPNSILDTSWGDVYVAYMPIRNPQRKTVAVLGMEYSAANELDKFRKTAFFSFLIAVIFVCLGTAASIKMFRKISNPLYKDISNTDFLTHLKNRNSLEIDVENIINRGTSAGYAVMMIDLNDLKKMNDTYGHEIGDQYIGSVADALRSIENLTQGIYRYGGDEFVILTGANQDLKDLQEQLQESFTEKVKNLPFHGSYAIGYASFDPFLDDNIHDTKRRADRMMYENKKQMKAARAK